MTVPSIIKFHSQDVIGNAKRGILEHLWLPWSQMGVEVRIIDRGVWMVRFRKNRSPTSQDGCGVFCLLQALLTSDSREITQFLM